MLLLVPADPLNPRRADEHFRPEAVAARELGVTVAVIDHDALSAGQAGAAAVRGVPADLEAVYRGWMLRSGQYRTLAQLLGERGTVLRTSPDQYRQAHQLPGWYDELRPVTPQSVWTTGADLGQFDDCCRRLGPGPAVLRDYVKSVKHRWAEAAFIPDTSDSGTARVVAERFLALRGEDFTGGLVLRRFESLAAAEVRTWWLYGECRLVTAHPDTPDELPGAPDLTAVAPLVASLALPFVTVDLALRRDGVWRVVELGDGQVSDRPVSTAAGDLIVAALGP